MLTLAAGSYCDVCAEEYGPHCLPHAIPCGHVLCASCCSTIAEKTPPRLTPVCPFCREHFTPDDVRRIRTDFNTSGWSTPRRIPPTVDSRLSESANELWARKADKMLASDTGCSRTREEARRLEDRVAKVAQKKSSVEEVSTLHRDLEDWLTSGVKSGEETSSSLFLSAALLRAILMNHVAHSEASKAAKHVETTLKGKLDDFEITNSKLEAELRRQRQDLSQKAQECQTLKTELNRLRVVATTLGPNALNDPRQTSPPITPSPTPAPTVPYSSASANAHSTLSRYNSVHARSASMQMSSRPTTPSTTRAYTPMPTPTVRSHTPVTPPTRSQTSMAMRFPTSTSPNTMRSQTPAPPLIPPKPRRLSIPSPPKIIRTLSEEKHEVHERWIPPSAPPLDNATKPGRYSSVPLTRTVSTSASSMAAARLRAQTPAPP